jgi:glycosyltransferase involved in cell wall biosynthesis
MFPADGTASAKAAAVARADHIICVSENTRRDLIELLNVAPNKTTVVHHGFSLTGKPLELAKIRASKRPFLLYVGHRGEYKNFSGMLKALARSVNLKKDFDIVCFGGGPLTASELDLIRKSGLPDEQVSQVSGNDDVLATLYKHASVFVYPSLYEGFGIPLLEAMSFDVPVACSNTSSLPEVVGNAALTFDPALPEAIGAAIESIVSNSELRADLVNKGRDRLKQFSWERCTAETLNTYGKALQ